MSSTHLDIGVNSPTLDHGPLVAVDAVTVTIGQTVLLPPLTTSLRAGEAVAVTGGNGTGKTTLLTLLCGLARPTSGTILIEGRIPDERSAAFRRTVAGMIGLPPFARDLTVREQLRLVAVSWGTLKAGSRDPESLADHWLERLGIEHLAHRFPHELSAGQLQLAGLALTAVRPSDLLIFDEPEQRLDSEKRAVVARLLAELRDEGRALVIATHSDVFVRTVGTTTLDMDHLSS